MTSARLFLSLSTSWLTIQQTGNTSKITDWVNPNDKSGEFKRQQSAFRNWISREPGAQFPPEKGRYHLYVSYACPWGMYNSYSIDLFCFLDFFVLNISARANPVSLVAHRTLITRKLKGLEDIISFSSVHWHLGEKGEYFYLSGMNVWGLTRF